jgi:hypothetical protein
MAYYPQTLTKAPKTVAVVQSFYNQTAMWIRNDSTLSATFPDAIVYSANLSGAQNQGDLAGSPPPESSQFLLTVLSRIRF